MGKQSRARRLPPPTAKVVRRLFPSTKNRASVTETLQVNYGEFLDRVRDLNNASPDAKWFCCELPQQSLSLSGTLSWQLHVRGKLSSVLRDEKVLVEQISEFKILLVAILKEFPLLHDALTESNTTLQVIQYVTINGITIENEAWTVCP